MMKTILITNNSDIATQAEAAGVSRIMVDLEIMGKKERQASRNTFISAHQKEDVAKIRTVLKKAELIVRINPWHANSFAEIDHAVAAGADMVMLPMITQLTHFDAFMAHLGQRVRALPLLETAYSMAHVNDIAAHPNIEEVYIGLNDLHLSLGLDFLFEPLALGLLDWMAIQIKAQQKKFGFGGVAAMGSGESLPPEWILGEHVRLGSECVILSSRFCKNVVIDEPQGRKQRLIDALRALQETHKQLLARTPEQQYIDARRTSGLIRELADAARKCNV